MPRNGFDQTLNEHKREKGKKEKENKRKEELREDQRYKQQYIIGFKGPDTWKRPDVRDPSDAGGFSFMLQGGFTYMLRRRDPN